MTMRKGNQQFAVRHRVRELEQRRERRRLRAQSEQQPDELEQQRVRPGRLCPLLKLNIETVEHRDWLPWHYAEICNTSARSGSSKRTSGRMD